MLYEVALTAGLRANELRSLRTYRCGTEPQALALYAEWTRSRQPGFQALADAIVSALAAFREAQPLAHHSSPQLTMNVYARANDARLQATVQRVRGLLAGAGSAPQKGRSAS